MTKRLFELFTLKSTIPLGHLLLWKFIQKVQGHGDSSRIQALTIELGQNIHIVS